ncbi:hypothetical protein BJP62_04010 [Jeongeupia sp. USM3]|nr:hypothetical protein BJP62_04010 [Jeongeupia sp. USM3]
MAYWVMMVCLVPVALADTMAGVADAKTRRCGLKLFVVGQDWDREEGREGLRGGMVVQMVIATTLTSETAVAMRQQPMRTMPLTNVV